MAKLKACAHKLKLLAEEDPQINLMAISRPQWETVSPSGAMIHQMYTAPDLSSIRFGTRVLIEGLIGLGTLKPGDVNELLTALRTHARVPAMQERILESLFGEERIRNVKNIVAGELQKPSRRLGHDEADGDRQGKIPETCPTSSIVPSSHDQECPHHPYPSVDWSTSAGTFELGDEAIRG